MNDDFDDVPSVPPQSPELSELVEFARSDLPNDEQWAALTAQVAHVWGGPGAPESPDPAAAPEPSAGHVSPSSGAAAGGAVGAGPASAALPGVAKVAGVAALAGALASGVWFGSRPSAPDEVAQSSTPAPQTAWVAETNERLTVAVPPVASLSAAPTPVAGTSAAPSTTPVVSKGGPAPSELRLLQEAREQLAKNPQRSLALCRQHQRRYPQGQLAQEREVLLIEALTRLNRDTEASKRRTEFGKTFPDSPHQSRVKQGTE